MSKLLTNNLLQQQNEGINSLVRHTQQQDWIRDYIYRINKLSLAKGVNESGLTVSAISEVRDFEVFSISPKDIQNTFHVIE